MAHDVFISHSTKDKPTADAVCHYLEREGIRCWIAPRDVLPGGDWAESIVEAIGNCRVMVLVFSSNANESSQINREINLAAEEQVPIVPFRIEDVKPSKKLRYYLGTPHWLDALTEPIEEHLEKLVATVSKLAPSVSAPEPQTDHPNIPDTGAGAPVVARSNAERDPGNFRESAADVTGSTRWDVHADSGIPGNALIVVGCFLLVNGFFSASLPLLLGEAADWSSAGIGMPILLVFGGLGCVLFGRQIIPKGISKADQVRGGLGAGLVITALFGPLKNSYPDPYSPVPYSDLLMSSRIVLEAGLIMAAPGVALVGSFFVSRVYPERYASRHTLFAFLTVAWPSLILSVVTGIAISAVLAPDAAIVYGFIFLMTLTALVACLFGHALRGVLGLLATAAAAGFVILAYVQVFSSANDIGFVVRDHVLRFAVTAVVVAGLGWCFAFLSRKIEDRIRK